MISLQAVRDAFQAGAALVAMDATGALRPVPRWASGPATALVRPISDALKVVTESGVIARSVDRGQTWLVELLIFSVDAAAALGEQLDSIDDVYEAIQASDTPWVVSQAPSDL